MASLTPWDRMASVLSKKIVGLLYFCIVSQASLLEIRLITVRGPDFVLSANAKPPFSSCTAVNVEILMMTAVKRSQSKI